LGLALNDASHSLSHAITDVALVELGRRTAMLDAVSKRTVWIEAPDVEVGPAGGGSSHAQRRVSADGPLSFSPDC